MSLEVKTSGNAIAVKLSYDSAVFGDSPTLTMATKLIFICGAFGVAVTAVVLLVVATFGFLVWLGGSSWARRP